jgi:hypothetical protein
MINGGIEIRLKEAVTTCFKVYTDVWPEELRRNTASLSRNNLQDATKEVDIGMRKEKFNGRKIWEVFVRWPHEAGMYWCEN